MKKKYISWILLKKASGVPFYEIHIFYKKLKYCRGMHAFSIINFTMDKIQFFVLLGVQSQ